MKNLLFKFFIFPLVFASFLSSPVLASGDSGVVKLGRVEAMPDNTVRIWAASGYAFSNPDSCDGVTMIRFDKGASFIISNPDAFDRIYSVMLTAITSGSDIRFWFGGCVTHGSSTVPLVYSASILAN